MSDRTGPATCLAVARLPSRHRAPRSVASSPQYASPSARCRRVRCAGFWWGIGADAYRRLPGGGHQFDRRTHGLSKAINVFVINNCTECDNYSVGHLESVVEQRRCLTCVVYVCDPQTCAGQMGQHRRTRDCRLSTRPTHSIRLFGCPSNSCKNMNIIARAISKTICKSLILSNKFIRHTL